MTKARDTRNRKLRELLEKASPRPWRVRDGNVEDFTGFGVHQDAELIVTVVNELWPLLHDSEEYTIAADERLTTITALRKIVEVDPWKTDVRELQGIAAGALAAIYPSRFGAK